MLLSACKKVCAAYHKVPASAFTVDSVDLFLVAANNVVSNAQLQHNFEMSRVQATLSIDGDAGGSLDDAVIIGDDGFTDVREVVAVQRTNTDGILVPLDFTRADIPIERDRYELELSEEYEPYRRYPSDAQLLQRGTNGTLVQRGRRLFIYPVAAITSSPLSVTIEGYGSLAEYDATTLTATEPPDFLMKFGGTYIQWAVACELNFLFKTWVPRTEGNLAAPEKERDTAWRNLILWDTYQVDANATRSR